MAAFRGAAGLAALRGNVVEDLFFRLEQDLSAEEVRAFTRVGAFESLLAGVGTVFDHYFQGEAVAAALADVGLTGAVAPTLQDLAGPGATGTARPSTPRSPSTSAPTCAPAGVVAALGPHATDTVSAGLWRAAIDLAEARGLPVHAHVAQSREEAARVLARHGTTPIGWLASEGILASSARLLLVHGIYVTDGDLTRLDPARHTLGFCPYSQVEFCFPAAVDRFARAGLPWLLATDCAASNDSMNVQKELRLASGLGLAAASFSSAADRFAAGPGTPDAAAALDAARQAAFDAWAPLREPATLLATVWSVPGRLHPALPCGAIEPGASPTCSSSIPTTPRSGPRWIRSARSRCATSRPPSTR
jgi:5-methylthioadenosine/S-adenosylhomocysteine deaminase